MEFEDWGGVKTQRAFFRDGLEAELNFATPSWANTNPLDKGTLRVVMGGAKILFDRAGMLELLLQAVDHQQEE